MSSLIGHLAAGAAVYLSERTVSKPRTYAVLATYLLLAVAPDFDYLALWLFHFQFVPRVTHSLLFAVGAALMAWLVVRSGRLQGAESSPLSSLLLASGSHLVLDFLVGVHGLPLLWPMLDHAYVSTVGILPSAGHLSWSNYFLWRNLLIELALLLPAMAALVLVRRRDWTTLIRRKNILIIPVWLACLAWSVSLSR